MDIYIVQAGDTIDKIADIYGMSVQKLINDNELTDPYNLVPGEIVIIVYPSETYTFQEGDTLETIAADNNITVTELLRNNPLLSDMASINPGDELTISYNRTESIATHGFTNTFIDRKILKKTLPYLTYLSVFNYQTVENGDIVGSNDDLDIIQSAKDYGVIPLMLMTTLSVQGEVDIELTYELLLNEEVQNRLIDNALKIVKDKGYYGINISAQYITSSNQTLFYNYTRKLSDRLRQEGFFSVITVNPRITIFNNEVTYENIDYSQISSIVDTIIFLQYKWGISVSPPSPVVSINNLNAFLEYVLLKVEPDRIITGIPTIGYLWELPFVVGFSRSNSISLNSAINLARDVGAIIEFDEPSQTPFFKYEDTSNNSIQYIVWFVNAITINSMVRILLDNGIKGTGIWNIMTYFTHLWLVINSQYKIVKYLPEL